MLHRSTHFRCTKKLREVYRFGPLIRYCFLFFFIFFFYNREEGGKEGMSVSDRLFPSRSCAPSRFSSFFPSSAFYSIEHAAVPTATPYIYYVQYIHQGEQSLNEKKHVGLSRRVAIRSLHIYLSFFNMCVVFLFNSPKRIKKKKEIKEIHTSGIEGYV